MRPALAEVCDKVAGEGWREVDGPVGLFGFGWLGWLIVILGLASACIVKTWSLRPLAVLTLLVALVDLFEINSSNEVVLAAVVEGCRSHLTGQTGLVLGIGMLIVGHRLNRLRARRQEQRDDE